MTERTLASGGDSNSADLSRLLPEIDRAHRTLVLQRDLPRPAEVRLRRNSSGRRQGHSTRFRNQRQRCPAHVGDCDHPPLCGAPWRLQFSGGCFASWSRSIYAATMTLENSARFAFFWQLGHNHSAGYPQPKSCSGCPAGGSGISEAHPHAAELVALAGGMVGVLPSVMQCFAGPMISQDPLTPFDGVRERTGPQYPCTCWARGGRLVSLCADRRRTGNLTCAILSYTA